VLRLLPYHDLLPHVLLITPEVLQGGPVRDRLADINNKSGRLARFVIDEADKFLAVRQAFSLLFEVSQIWCTEDSGVKRFVFL
jgi:hypothetical protein